jgi:NitT/TauT family transport system permease protein
MQRTPVFRKFSAVPDLVIVLLVGTLIYGLVAISQEWRAEFQPVTHIDLSIWSLPKYTLFSGIRGFVAYGLSLIFTLVVGYVAAKSPRAERIIIPALDILQSIPVLGFLPGLVLGLVALFPNSNMGIELAAILMIFTGQVWNMTFSYYSSLKSIPADFMEASTVMGLNWKERLIKLELPYSAVGLTWNSVMSMAGGWFFLSTCEALRLGNTDYRIPGIGSYMAVASEQDDWRAMVSGVIAMIFLIVLIDFFLWRPMLAYVQRFRLEDVPGAAPEEPLMNAMVRESRLVRWVRLQFRRYRFEHAHPLHEEGRSQHSVLADAHAPAETPATVTALKSLRESPAQTLRRQTSGLRKVLVKRANLIGKISTVIILIVIAYSGWGLLGVLSHVNRSTWIMLLRNTFWSFLRVMAAVVLSTIWTVPFGIWVGISSKRIRIFQPIIQLLASFPAPMLYPLMLMVLFRIGMNFDWSSMLLMQFGVQWYVLFNVLAGALRIPRQLLDAMELMNTPVWDRWKTLYIPSVFPALVTGWVTAAGGAWNATIVAEYVPFQHHMLTTGGLGATISQAVESKDFPVFAASLTIMVVMVILLNQAVWGRIYHLAQTRYRMDL